MAEYHPRPERYPPSTADIQQAKRVGDPTLSTCIDDLDPVIGRAAQYAERLHHLADRIHGAQPAPSRQRGEEQAPTLIAALNLRRVRLVEVLNEIEQALDRLEGSI